MNLETDMDPEVDLDPEAEESIMSVGRGLLLLCLLLGKILNRMTALMYVVVPFHEDELIFHSLHVFLRRVMYQL